MTGSTHKGHRASVEEEETGEIPNIPNLKHDKQVRKGD
jgi:hypothetical protein